MPASTGPVNTDSPKPVRITGSGITAAAACRLAACWASSSRPKLGASPPRAASLSRAARSVRDRSAEPSRRLGVRAA